MSDSLKWLLWLLGLILLLWTTFCVDSCKQSWQHILCIECIQEDTTANTAPIAPPPDTIQSRLPIDYEWDNSRAFQNSDYDAYRSRILEGYKEGQILEITGEYYEGESTPEGFENRGFARAAALRDLLSPDIPADKIVLKSSLLAADEKAKTGFFAGHSYEWVAADKEADIVEVINGCTVIRFNFNSTDGQLDAQIIESLDKIADRVRKTGEKVTITGHTDNVGSEDYNMNLGRKRAIDIRTELRNRNVNRDQISADSKGETQPVATNDTERGMAENRRVEVCLSE